MRLTFITALFLVISCQNPAPTTGSGEDNRGDNISGTEVIIPQNVLNYLKDNFPGWEIPDTSEYMKAWWTFYDRDQITYYVTTDFNDDGLADYAFTLKSPDSLRLVILVSDGNAFTHWVAEDFNEPYSGNNLKFGLMITPPGRTDRVVDDIPVSLILKSNGIAFMEEEVMIRIYYWDDRKFKVLRAK